MLRFLGFLVVLALLIFAIGVFLDWWNVSATSRGSEAERVTVDVDKKQIDEDLGRASRAAKSAVDDVTDGGDDETVDGVVTEVDTSQSRLRVRRTDGSEMVFRLDERTEVEIDGSPAVLTEVQKDDRAKIAYRSESEIPHATRVEISRG